MISSRQYRVAAKGGRGCQRALRKAVAAPWHRRAPRSSWGGRFGHAGRPRGDTGALVMVMESASATFCCQWEEGGGGERGRPPLEAVVARGRVCATQSTGRDGGATGEGGRCAKAARRDGCVNGRADGRPSGDRSSAGPGHTILMWSAAAMPQQPPWPPPTPRWSFRRDRRSHLL